MGKPFKRQRIKTGQNTWINRTIGPNGVKESYSNKCGNVTYNHNPKRGNRMWTNFAGWTQSTRTSNRKTKKRLLWDLGFSFKKKKPSKVSSKVQPKFSFGSSPKAPAKPLSLWELKQRELLRLEREKRKREADEFYAKHSGKLWLLLILVIGIVQCSTR